MREFGVIDTAFGVRLEIKEIQLEHISQPFSTECLRWIKLDDMERNRLR
jgi:hypothetical protein